MNNFTIKDDGRRLPSGGPMNDEHYGPCWQIVCDGAVAVIVPDPGDGSTRPLVENILDLLNRPHYDAGMVIRDCRVVANDSAVVMEEPCVGLRSNLIVTPEMAESYPSDPRCILIHGCYCLRTAENQEK